MATRMAIHHVSEITMGDVIEGKTDSGPYATAALTIRQNDGGVMLIQLFAPTRDRLRVLGSDLATLMQVEGRA